MRWRHLTITLRRLRRDKGYTFINVVGLAVGMACCLLIGAWVRHELSYDQFHEGADQVYRVALVRHYENGRVEDYAPASPPLAPLLEAALPEVEAAVRLFSPRWTTGEALLQHEEVQFAEDCLFYADPDVFRVLGFELLQGDPATALTDPHAVVLSERAAHRFFGDAPPLGRPLVLDDSIALQVTGVMRDLPPNTHLKADVLVPFSLIGEQYGERFLNL